MKFAIMARSLKYQESGIRTLLYGLLQGLIEIQPDHEIFLFIDPKQHVPKFLNNSIFDIIRISPGTDKFLGRFIWDHISIGLTCKKLKIDALLAPAHMRPVYVPCPVIVQVPDMMYHKFPQYWPWWDRSYFKIGVSLLTIRASGIIAISENTKNDLQEILSIDENKIRVIYPGVSKEFRVLNKNDTLVIRKKYNLFKPFILCVSSFHPRKNLIGLISAFEVVSDKIAHDLVIKVTSNWQMSVCKNKIINSPLRERIHIIEGLISPLELAYLLNEADLFVFPSLYEGFGFPVLESIACGCPTISTNISSIPEIVGDSAILVSPDDTNELSNAIYRVLSDQYLRNNLGRLGIIRARQFDWVLNAQMTLKFLEQIT
jgi:glycosyltransferase involved in cell wall biosynthesis